MCNALDSFANNRPNFETGLAVWLCYFKDKSSFINHKFDNLSLLCWLFSFLVNLYWFYHWFVCRHCQPDMPLRIMIQFRSLTPINYPIFVVWLTDWLIDVGLSLLLDLDLVQFSICLMTTTTTTMTIIIIIINMCSIIYKDKDCVLVCSNERVLPNLSCVCMYVVYIYVSNQ